MSVEELNEEARHQSWTLDDIAWDQIKPGAMKGLDEIFYIVASASFMESTTDLYTENLIDFFGDDEEITSWLRNHWMEEELQHGRALQRYVEVAWPSFDWVTTYKKFLDEFSSYCAPDALEPTCGMEMVSRCAVEMGTAGYYTTIQRISPEPVLTELARLIYQDEVRHYKYFYHYFLRLKEEEALGRGQVAMALWRRLRMTGGEDSFIALKHVYTSHHPGRHYDAKVYRDLRSRCRDMAVDHFPHDLCVKMLLRPLDLGPRIQSMAVPVMEALARRLVP